MRRAGFWVALVVGWRLAMSYPLDDSAPALLGSLAIGTLGVLIVAVASYFAGSLDAHP